MENPYTIWTILAYRMMYPVYGTLLILIGLYMSNANRYNNAKKILLQKLSDKSFIANLNNYESTADLKKYDHISSGLNELDGYRYFDLLFINNENDSCVYLTEKLKCFFEKNQMKKRKMYEGLKTNPGITMVKTSMGRIFGCPVSTNLFLLVMIAGVSFPLVGKR
jgi:hypothetical protein